MPTSISTNLRRYSKPHSHSHNHDSAEPHGLALPHVFEAQKNIVLLFVSYLFYRSYPGETTGHRVDPFEVFIDFVVKPFFVGHSTHKRIV